MERILFVNHVKKYLILIWLQIFFFASALYSQSNLIQSIDFDSQNRAVYGLTGNYDSSYVVRYKNGNKQIWNLTSLFNTQFYWISTCVDNNDNIWAFMQNSLYKFDGSTWNEIPLPTNITSYMKYSDLNVKDDNIFLSIYHASIYGYPSIFRYNKSTNNWKLFDSSNSDLPGNILTGKIFIKDDSVFIGSNKGLILIYNDSASVLLDSSNSNLETEAIYSFYIDANGKRWLGTFDKGLVEWIDNFNLRYFNQANSALPNNFINALDEDSNGNLWIATDNGFACLRNDTIYSYLNLTSESIAELKVDNQNKIWMGEVGSGKLLVFDGINLSVITETKDYHYNNIPNTFILYQNYPNPFNPSTKIKYVIPNLESGFSAGGGLTILKVYDIPGNEVATLVNEEKPAGVYEVEFNAGNLSSGTYFYRLTAGEFTEMKKLILIK